MSEQQNQLSTQLIQSVADLQDQEVLRLVHERVSLGHDPMEIVEDCRQGMIEVGRRYEQRQYYLSGLLLAGEILREVMEIIQPLTDRKFHGKSRGVVVLGTVQGDIHDAGKDLFQLLLTVYGFTVRDLGVDVPAEDFVKEAREHQPIAVGLSCLITGAYTSMKATVELMRAQPDLAGIPIVIGGQVSEDVCEYVGADHWSRDAMDGVRWCERLIGDKSGEQK